MLLLLCAIIIPLPLAHYGKTGIYPEEVDIQDIAFIAKNFGKTYS